MAQRKMVQDWLTVRTTAPGERIQSRDKYLRMGPDDLTLRIECAGVTGTVALNIETAPSEEGPWDVLFTVNAPGVILVPLRGETYGVVRWRLSVNGAGDGLTFRVTVPGEGSGLEPPGRLRGPSSTTLQGWVTILLSDLVSEVIQSEEYWFDAGSLPSVCVLVQAPAVSGCSLILETSEAREGPWTQLAKLSGAAGGTNHAAQYVFLRDDADAALALKRYLRWRIADGGNGDYASFRLAISPSGGYAQHGAGAGDEGAGCRCGPCCGGGAYAPRLYAKTACEDLKAQYDDLQEQLAAAASEGDPNVMSGLAMQMNLLLLKADAMGCAWAQWPAWVMMMEKLKALQQGLRKKPPENPLQHVGPRPDPSPFFPMRRTVPRRF
jgi:hypothetical protein